MRKPGDRPIYIHYLAIWTRAGETFILAKMDIKTACCRLSKFAQAGRLLFSRRVLGNGVVRGGDDRHKTVNLYWRGRNVALRYRLQQLAVHRDSDSSRRT